MKASHRRHEMDAFRVESVRIKAPIDRVFEYIAAQQNLPEWTHAFKSAGNGKALMATPAGKVEVDLKVKSSRAEGTIDWHMRFPDGNEAAAYSRLVPESSERAFTALSCWRRPFPWHSSRGP
jgi:uncharacterized protein YndB with AHSA1/START domain